MRQSLNKVENLFNTVAREYAETFWGEHERDRKTRRYSADSRKRSSSSDAAMVERYKNATDEFAEAVSEKVIPYLIQPVT